VSPNTSPSTSSISYPGRSFMVVMIIGVPRSGPLAAWPLLAGG
jgi:hypothetical protein